MRIAVIGGGYVGLVSGACLAKKGHDVLIVDQNEKKVNLINRGISPIHEKDLDAILQSVLGAKLHATTHLEEAVKASDLTMLAVGTPFDGDEIDLGQIEDACIAVGHSLKHMEKYHVVVVKSTVVPGTSDDLVTPLLELHSGKKGGKDFGVGMNPEFLREGCAVDDFMNPDRIVIGGNDQQTRDRVGDLYEPFAGVDKVFVNNRTAEMIKYTSNSLLATLISFSNEIGNLCSAIDGVDVVDVLAAVKLDKRHSPILANGDRISPEINTYLAAGCGFGGSCFPKDVNALRAYGEQRDIALPLLDAVMQTNVAQPDKIIALLKKNKIDLARSTVAVLGLAFKPGTDDVRESPALPLVTHLSLSGANVVCCDPAAINATQELLGDIDVSYTTSMIEAIGDADVIILVTSWPEFSELPDVIASRARQPLVIDGRRMLRASEVARYEGIGLGKRSEYISKTSHNLGKSSSAA